MVWLGLHQTFGHTVAADPQSTGQKTKRLGMQGGTYHSGAAMKVMVIRVDAAVLLLQCM